MDRIVVVAVHDPHLGSIRLDGADPGDGGVLVDVDDGFAVELAGAPGDTAAVVAVGGGGERDVADLVAGRLAHQFFVTQIFAFEIQLGADESVDGERAAENLE